MLIALKIILINVHGKLKSVYLQCLLFIFYLYILQSATAHMNLGAMYHINNKLKEAEASYLRALELKPDDVTTQQNLVKLRNLMSKS